MAKQRKKLLIVDGYNVLRSGRRYRTIAGPDYTHDAFNRAGINFPFPQQTIHVVKD